MTVSPTRPLLRYHGGKWRLASWILEYLPPHDIYVEPFGGAASILLKKQRSTAEVYNDLDGEIVNLFRVVRERGDDLQRCVALTPYARDEFDLSFEPATDPLEQARRTLVRSHLGFGGNLTRLTKDGRLERTGFRDYTKKNRRSIPAQDWSHLPESLAILCERLRGVIIENRAAVEVMSKHDGTSTVHYVDPPYVHSTRMTGKTAYRHEMDDQQHSELAGFLHGLRGAVLLSGYDCQLYSELYRDWICVQKSAMADGARARTEFLWLNPRAQEANRRLL